MKSDLEISKALALAIGWKRVLTSTASDACYVKFRLEKTWRVFDFRDWAVIGPIAAKFDCFPGYSPTQGWFANVYGYPGGYADTPQKAVAMAVIGGAQCHTSA